MQTTYTTAAIRPTERLDWWRDIVCQHYVPAACDNRSDGTFNASFSSRPLGCFEIGSLHAVKHSWSRGSVQIDNDGRDDFLLSMVIEGTGTLQQGDKTLRQVPGEILLYDTRRPFTYELTDYTAVFRVPREMLAASNLEGAPYALSRGNSPVLRDALQGLLRYSAMHSAMSESDDASGVHLGNSIFHLLLSILHADTADLLPASSNQVAQFERISRKIMDRLGDCSISCEMLARDAGVSVRTLNRLFAAIGTTPMRWVWQQRLEAAKRDLERRNVETVTDAAFRYGFSELSHFSRSFKAAFGLTPQSILRTGQHRDDTTVRASLLNS